MCKIQGKVAKDYKLLGYRDVADKPTTSPGDALYNEISKWPRFTVNF